MPRGIQVGLSCSLKTWRIASEPKMKIVFFFFCILFGGSLADYNRLRCLVCRVTIQEMTKQIDNVNPNKKIQVGGYRLDDTGKLEEKLVSKIEIEIMKLRFKFTCFRSPDHTIPFARSGMHLSELMDSICEKMENYVRATEKESKKLVLLNLFSGSDVMNPEISNVDIIQDSDLNKSLTFYCEGIVEEFEDDIYNVLKEPSVDPVDGVCTKATKLCDNTIKDEL